MREKDKEREREHEREEAHSKINNTQLLHYVGTHAQENAKPNEFI